MLTHGVGHGAGTVLGGTWPRKGQDSISTSVLQGHCIPGGQWSTEQFEGPSWLWPCTDQPHPLNCNICCSCFFHSGKLLVRGQHLSFNKPGYIFQAISTLKSLHLGIPSSAQTLIMPIPKDLKVLGNHGWTCSCLSHTTGSVCSRDYRLHPPWLHITPGPL